MNLPIVFYGIIARIINLFIPTQKKHWVFGSDYGNMYREGPKYMIEYMIKEHPNYTCTFITRNPDVKRELDKKGIPCFMNFSLKGIVEIAKAEAVFTSQVIVDVLFAYKKKGRNHFQLVHGQPLKQAALSLSENYINNIKGKTSSLEALWLKFCRFLNEGVKLTDSAFVSASSDFLAPFMEKDFAYKTPVLVLGMPRNDALFQPERMKEERWVEGLGEKFVITYMPTHRKYGKGELSPSPFIHRPEFQEWMHKNGVVLLVKQHPNMIPKLKDIEQTDVIRDITCKKLDPQVCIYHSDVLITDYSSVWMDYLLLKRPIIFYYYDDFEHDDAGVHYDIREDPPGYFCYTEDELFYLIQKIKNEYDSMCPNGHIIEKYHKYVDGNSCERYYNAVVQTFQKKWK